MNQSAPHFYSRFGLHVEIYDTQTQTGWGSIHNDVDFYLDEATAAGGPIFELACGTGRLLLPLLSSGLEVHGLDASEPMLNVVQQKRIALSAEDRKRLHLHPGDMTRFELNREFSLIIIAFRSFQALLTPQDQRACLTSIRRHLAPNGRAILNLFDPRYDLIVPGRQQSSQEPRELRHPVSGNLVLVEVLDRINDPVSQTFAERWRFTERTEDGSVLRQEEEELRLRWTFRQEMRHLVELCDLAIEEEYSDFQRSAPAYGKEQIWVLKRR
jgi:SAM-dependent methyltransferase